MRTCVPRIIYFKFFNEINGHIIVPLFIMSPILKVYNDLITAVASPELKLSKSYFLHGRL